MRKYKKIITINIILLLSISYICAVSGSENGILRVGEFSGYSSWEELSREWESLVFRGIDETEYSLTKLDGKTVLKAESDISGSGLIKRVDIDLEEYPVMVWSWKTENILEKGDVRTKEGDDYPARIYVVFDYDIKNFGFWERTKIRLARAIYGDVPTRAINYIWESSAPEGTVVSSPYTDMSIMVVVESGEENLNKWVSYKRNIYNDYIEIFGEKPVKINSIALMTDTDATEESAVTYFGDIYFSRKRNSIDNP